MKWWLSSSSPRADPPPTRARRGLQGAHRHHKIPKAFIRTDKVLRSPAGKADYRWARRWPPKALVRKAKTGPGVRAGGSEVTGDTNWTAAITRDLDGQCAAPSYRSVVVVVGRVGTTTSRRVRRWGRGRARLGVQGRWVGGPGIGC